VPETCEQILRLSVSRNSRCAQALRLENLGQLGACVDADPEAHYTVSLIGDCSKCKK